MTREQASQIVATLAAHYPSQAKLSPDNVNAFLANLGLYPHEIAKQALKRVVQTSVFFPSVAELVTSIIEVALGLPSPDAAWLLVLECQRTDTWDGLPPAVRVALRAAGGSYAVKTIKTHLVRKAFLDSYVATRKEAADHLRETELPRIEREKQARLSAAPAVGAEGYAAAREEVEKREKQDAAKRAGA